MSGQITVIGSPTRQKFTLTGTDQFGNEVTETLELPDIGGSVTSEHTYASLGKSEPVKQFKRLRKLYVPYLAKNGKWRYKNVLHSRLFYVFWNLRCRLHRLFSDHDDSEGVD